MNKIIKWITWALMLVGVVLTVLVFAQNGSDGSVNALLYWTYAMAVLAIVAILIAIGRDCVINPKTLVRIGLVLGGAVVLIGVAYAFASGAPAVGYVGAPVSDGELKLTDTILNLTYITVAAAVVAIITSAIMDAVKK